MRKLCHDVFPPPIVLQSADDGCKGDELWTLSKVEQSTVLIKLILEKLYCTFISIKTYRYLETSDG
uniref:Uncharacterized protein n=1 Tax=Arundo donax TaxID=35708 RepID=A0A0A8ZLP3_ARUDO